MGSPMGGLVLFFAAGEGGGILRGRCDVFFQENAALNGSWRHGGVWRERRTRREAGRFVEAQGGVKDVAGFEDQARNVAGVVSTITGK